LRVAFAEWPDGLMPSGPLWDAIASEVQAAQPDLLVTDQLPFGPWLAGSPRFNREAANASVELHREGLQALASLDLPAVITSRPVWSGERLVNECVAIEGDSVRFLHRKQVLPDQEGWRETAWFEPGREGFLTADVLGVRVGVLLCTELMFNEKARLYGAAGAELIAVPRATPEGSPCQVAAAMASIVSGSYVVSSCRVGRIGDGPDFGGLGFAYGPEGALLATTAPGRSVCVIEIDAAVSRRQKSRYPCYLEEPQAG
jgi:N-carbamoylputrescine amidase